MIRVPPPHILYPCMVLGLLTMSITASFSILFFARSDGGAQVERDYYERSLSWDDDQHARGMAGALGWTVDLSVAGSLHVSDAHERPVTGIAGTVVTRRPFLADPVASSPLKAVAGQAGLYEFTSGVDGPGLWDFLILAVAPGGEPVILELRRDSP